MKEDVIPGGNFESDESKVFKSERPSWTDGCIAGENLISYGNIEYHYLILDKKKLNEKNISTPEKFATYTINDQEYPVVLSVSDTYPEKYRDLCVLHEIIEQVDFKGRCASDEECLCSLKKELSIASEMDVDFKEYIPVRINFFEDVISYYESQKDSPEKEKMLVKLKKSLEHLKSLEKEMMSAS